MTIQKVFAYIIAFIQQMKQECKDYTDQQVVSCGHKVENGVLYISTDEGE